MDSSPAAPRAVLFDAYGTLFDVYSVGLAAERLFPGAGERRGVRAGILSNGDPDMLEAVVRHAGFAGLVDPVLSVESTGRFKTDPATYALGTEALGLAAADVLFVSSNCWDAIGATWFGYTTLWVNLFGLLLDELGAAPTRIGTSLRDVLSFFPSVSS